MKLPLAILLLGCFFVLPAQESGTIPRWKVIEMAEALRAGSGDIVKILSQVRPKEWIQDGAPDAYVAQYETLQGDLSHLANSARALERQPEKLSTTVDTFLWMDRVSSMTISMAAGVRKYQNPSLGDLLNSTASRFISVGDRLKEYMRQLAVDQEAELDIANSEAQRCRQEMLKRPMTGDSRNGNK